MSRLGQMLPSGPVGSSFIVLTQLVPLNFAAFVLGQSIFLLSPAFGSLFGSRWKCNFFNCLNKEVRSFAFVKGAKKKVRKNCAFSRQQRVGLSKNIFLFWRKTLPGWDIKEYQNIFYTWFGSTKTRSWIFKVGAPYLPFFFLRHS